jgi:thiol-disulfide isomerase/thioredoxin
VLALVVAVVLAAGLAVGLTTTGGSPDARAPGFSLPRLGGGARVALPLTGGAARHPVVLTFFASWCGPCHKELPMIAAVARREEAGGGRVQFVGVDGNDDPAAGLAFARASGVAFPVAADAYSEVAPKFTLVGYPGTVFIDAAGDIVATVHGPVSRPTLEAWVARLQTSRA